MGVRTRTLPVAGCSNLVDILARFASSVRTYIWPVNWENTCGSMYGIKYGSLYVSCYGYRCGYLPGPYMDVRMVLFMFYRMVLYKSVLMAMRPCCATAIRMPLLRVFLPAFYMDLR